MAIRYRRRRSASDRARQLAEVDEALLGVSVAPLVSVANRDAAERLAAIEASGLEESLDLAGVELLIAVRVRGGDQIGPTDDRAVVGRVDVVKRVSQSRRAAFSVVKISKWTSGPSSGPRLTVPTYPTSRRPPRVDRGRPPARRRTPTRRSGAACASDCNHGIALASAEPRGRQVEVRQQRIEGERTVADVDVVPDEDEGRRGDAGRRPPHRHDPPANRRANRRSQRRPEMDAGVVEAIGRDREVARRSLFGVDEGRAAGRQQLRLRPRQLRESADLDRQLEPVQRPQDVAASRARPDPTSSSRCAGDPEFPRRPADRAACP